MFVNRLNHQNKLVNPKKRLTPVMLLYTVICIFLLVSFYKNIKLLIKSREELTQAQAQLEAEKEKIAENKEKINTIGNLSYVDRVARDTLGLSKAGELTLVFPSEADLKKLSPRLFEKKGENTSDEVSHYKAWLQLLF